MAYFPLRQVKKAAIWKTSPPWLLLTTSTIALLFQITYLLFVYSKLPPQIALFYSLPWGNSQLTSPLFLFLLPAITLLILLANWILTHLTDDKFIHQLLWITTCLIACMASYTLIRIILVTI